MAVHPAERPTSARTGLFNALDLPLGESDVPQVSGEVNGLTLDGIPETANV